MIRSIFILCNGTPLYTETDKPTEDIHALLSGFLSAFQVLAHNINEASINKVELETKTYYYANKEPILSVVEATKDDDLDDQVYQIAAERIARKFLETYPKRLIDKWCGDLDDFIGFKDSTSVVVDEIEQMRSQSHKEFITKYFVEAAKDEKILGAVVFDLNQDEIVASDIPPDIAVEDFEAFGSMLFSFIDRLGKQLKAGGINELIIRAKNYWIGGFRKVDLAVFMIFTMDYFGKIMPDFVKDLIE
ncbi:MAG: hypothetical protein GF364_10885 [Candidatus Lokiarchaeota archaeon]|nr:hypothetical protein [Candidatus Lokiarchaeota archaeon]